MMSNLHALCWYNSIMRAIDDDEVRNKSSKLDRYADVFEGLEA